MEKFNKREPIVLFQIIPCVKQEFNLGNWFTCLFYNVFVSLLFYPLFFPQSIPVTSPVLIFFVNLTSVLRDPHVWPAYIRHKGFLPFSGFQLEALDVGFYPFIRFCHSFKWSILIRKTVTALLLKNSRKRGRQRRMLLYSKEEWKKEE